MTVLSMVDASARAAVRVLMKMFSRIRSAFARCAAIIAEARIHRARLEAEMYLHRMRLRSKNDDDMPFLI